jgi:SH3-like domain-containing protein
VFASGCARFHEAQHEMVYVSARQMYLHDRVAAVSNRVAEVVNGQPLEVIDHGRRFIKVKTQKDEIGWIEERAVIDAKTFATFDQLSTQHKQDPVVATATLRDDLYLHLRPGRETEHFYLLAENAKVQLLTRTSVPKGPAPGITPPRPAVPAAQTAAPAAPVAASSKTSAKLPAAPASGQLPPLQPILSPVQLEDWWLVRDAQGRTGWMLAGRLDVDVPDEVAAYSEGQRMIGAYILTKVHDDESSTPDHFVPEYVTVLTPPKAGLPFDFDQVRVFTWSLKRHRYETAFRLHPIQGYLPVRVTQQPSGAASLPAFSFQIANGADISVDPDTGVTRPASPRTINYIMNDTQVRRTGPDMGPIPITHSAEDKTKTDKAAKPAKKKSR